MRLIQDYVRVCNVAVIWFSVRILSIVKTRGVTKNLHMYLSLDYYDVVDSRG